MNSLIGDILPLATGIAISPMPIIAAILMLFSPRKGASIGYLAGWIIGVAVMFTLFISLSSLVEEDQASGDQPVKGLIKIALGLAIIYLGYKKWNEHDYLAGAGLSVQGASIRMQMTSLRGSGILLQGGGGSALLGFSEAKIEIASEDEVSSILSAWADARPTLTIGALKASNNSIPAQINAGGFNRHTFMCGQSGSGKTYSLGVLLEQILMHTDLRVAILDPNADYVHLGSPSPKMQSAEPGSREDQLAQNYLARTESLQVFRPVVEDDARELPLRIRFIDLSQEDQAKVMMLDPLVDRDEYDAFRRMADRLGDQPYQVGDIREAALDDLSSVARQVLLRVSNLGVGEWSVWADSDEQSLSDVLSSPWRSIVLDVSRFERPIERSVMALATLRHFWNRRTDRKPVLLVIDEAHNVCPKDPTDPIQAAATELAIAIAGEGRKYGIYMLLSTQRPDKIHPNVVSQCDNLMLMRMNSQADLAELQQVFSFVPPAVLAESVAFRQGEALIAGTLVHSPMLTRMGQRISREGGADVETTWTTVSPEQFCRNQLLLQKSYLLVVLVSDR